MAPHTRTETATLVDRFYTLITESALRHQVSQSYLQAIIHQESGGNERALRQEPRIHDVSYGLMQLLGRTAKRLGFTGPLAGLFDPRTNIALGTRYFSGLLTRYPEPGAALAHYNGGPKAGRAWLRGERRTRATRYARTVLALREYYLRRNRALGR